MKREPSPLWNDAVLAAALFAVAPHALGGIHLRAGSGPVRERWLGTLLGLLDPNLPVRRLHPGIDDAALLGGLDLANTIKRGSATLSLGAFATAHQGVVILAMAERCSAHTAARFAAALDTGTVRLERDGAGHTFPAAFGLIALDEGVDEEAPPAALRDRLVLTIDLRELSIHDLGEPCFTDVDIAAARRRLADTTVGGQAIEAIAAAGLSLGVLSFRATLLACQLARVSAALFNHPEVEASDAALAARLALSPHATSCAAPGVEEGPPEPEQHQPSDSDSPSAKQDEAASAASESPSPAAQQSPAESGPAQDSSELQQQVLDAAQASIPRDLLQGLLQGAGKANTASSGRSGAAALNMRQGRPISASNSAPRPGERLDLIGTLRAAAPWQLLRRQQRQTNAIEQVRSNPVQIRTRDFKAKRYVKRSQTTTLFAVDASGSSAMQRLAETKGAVELLLAQCYIRRDQVAVLSFRDSSAELVLPPTRSLVRAKRSLAGLAAGGGTPLAAALDALVLLADGIRRRGDTPVVVVLSDGRANVARDCSHNRERAHADAMRAALNLRGLGVSSVFVDTSARTSELAARIANQMGARYLPLPYLDARSLSAAVQSIAR